MKKVITEKDIMEAKTDLERVRILLAIIKGQVIYRSGVIQNE